MEYHTIKWFKNRIGKRIFRDETKPYCCSVCERNGKEGLIIYDKQHAEYLKLCQDEMNIEYRNNK